MSEAIRQPKQDVAPVPGLVADKPPPDGAGDEVQAAELASNRLVPVAEAIKYRRRAQQAESRLRQIEQRLQDVQTQFEQRLEQLATAEAQRDELQHQLDLAHRRSSAERLLHAAGVADLETAMTLLEKRSGLSEELDGDRLHQAIDQLLQDKPFLVSAAPPLPDKTASPRLRNAGIAARTAQAAAKATQTGSRRALGEYLRLRRQSQAT